MLVRKYKLLMKMYDNYLENGEEDYGITSREAEEYFEFEVGVTRCSNILKKLEGLGFVTKKKEKLRKNVWNYRYYITKEGMHKCEALLKWEQNQQNH